MKKLFLLLFLTANLYSQSLTDLNKAAWKACNGCLKDGGADATSEAFAILENNAYSSNVAKFRTFFNNLYASESWISGNRGAWLIAAQLCYWENGKFPTAMRDSLLDRLNDLPGDDYVWSTAWANGNWNSIATRYIMAQYNTGATCIYGDGTYPNTSDSLFLSTPWSFTFTDGSGTRGYKRGQRYNAFALSRDWMYKAMQRFIDADYMGGEIRSETYAFHFLNAMITLADSRMVSDATMHNRAQMTADIFLLEHGVAANGRNLSAPLGRIYMQSHLNGNFFLFPFDAYFGKPWPTHYGHTGSFYVSNYRVPPIIEDICSYDDENIYYTHVVKTTMQRSYSYITKQFTMGSGPDEGQSWALDLVSNTGGPYPLARPGFGFRLWMNTNPRDLDPQWCEDEGAPECYSYMGENSHQYRDAMLIASGGVYLHQALTNNQWDFTESVSGWNFKIENNVAVAIKIGASSAAIEVSRIGVDNNNYAEFKSDVINVANLNGLQYRTRRGDYIEAIGGITYVKVGSGNLTQFNTNWPRLQVENVTNGTVPYYIVNTPSVRIFSLSHHGATRSYNFNDWTVSGTIPTTDITPPASPINLRVSQ